MGLCLHKTLEVRTKERCLAIIHIQLTVQDENLLIERLRIKNQYSADGNARFE